MNARIRTASLNLPARNRPPKDSELGSRLEIARPGIGGPVTARTTAPTSRRIWLVLAPVAAVATWPIAEQIFAFEVEKAAGEPQAMTALVVLIGSVIISLLG